MEPQLADLQLTTRCLHGHQVVVVAGEIDICTAPVLTAYLLSAAYITSSKGGIDVVVDLSAVTFMDASGLTVLLRADHRARRAGGHLRLAAPTARIARLLAITHLDLYFDLYLGDVDGVGPAVAADLGGVPDHGLDQVTWGTDPFPLGLGPPRAAGVRRCQVVQHRGDFRPRRPGDPSPRPRRCSPT